MRRLPSSSDDAHAGVVAALVEERAGALGRAGRRLEEAVDTHRLLVEVGWATPEQVDAALDGVREALFALVVQRECAGFRRDNLGWIRRCYDVPDEAVRRL